MTTAPRAARSSSTPDTNGNMIRSGPCAAARSSARNCAWKMSSIARLRRMPRSPSGARGAFDAGMLERQLRLADVERPNRHAAGRHALDQPRVGVVLRLLRQRRAVRPRRAGTPIGTARCRPRPPRALCSASSGDSTLASSRICDAVCGDRRQPAIFVERLLVGLATLLRVLTCVERRRDRDRRRLRRSRRRRRAARPARSALLALRRPATAGT